MSQASRYASTEAFLRGRDEDWPGLVERIGPCRHDPKPARGLTKLWCGRLTTNN